MSPAASNSAELVSSSRAIDGEASSVRDAPWSVGEQSESGVKSSFGLDEPPPQAQIAIPPHERAQTGPPPLSSSSGGAETTGAPATDSTLNRVERPAGSASTRHGAATGCRAHARARVAATHACLRATAREQVSPTARHACRAARERRGRERSSAQTMLAELDTLPTGSAACGSFFLAHAGARSAALGSIADDTQRRARSKARGGRGGRHTARARPSTDGTHRRDAASRGRGRNRPVRQGALRRHYDNTLTDFI